MRIKQSVWIGIGSISLLLASSLAFYYERQAVHYRREWQAAVNELHRVAVTVTVPSPAPETQPPSQPVGPAIGVTPREAPPPQVPPTAVAATSPTPSGSDRFRRPSDWMENLRTNDPQRYAEFQQRRQAMQQNAENAWAQATDYFMNRDTSQMTQSEQEEYNTMLSFLEQAGALNQQLQSGLPPEQRHQVMSELRSNVLAVVPLLDNERNREYYDMALTMGHSEEDAAALVNYINQIASNTTLRSILPGLRMGGRR